MKVYQVVTTPGNKESPFIQDLEYSLRQIQRKYITENNLQNCILHHLIHSPSSFFTGVLRLWVSSEYGCPQPCYKIFTHYKPHHAIPPLFQIIPLREPFIFIFYLKDWVNTLQHSNLYYVYPAYKNPALQEHLS